MWTEFVGGPRGGAGTQIVSAPWRYAGVHHGLVTKTREGGGENHPSYPARRTESLAEMGSTVESEKL